MRAEDIADRLADAGLVPGDAAAKRELFARTLDDFRARTGTVPSAVWWVPGRLEIFGKHTDYCGGHSLVATVPRGFAMAARARNDGLLRVADAQRRDEVVLAGRDPDGGGGRRFTGWRNYVDEVARRLMRNFAGADLSADLVFASDLPSASGMSSSSALVVAVSAALVARAGLRRRPEWMQNIPDPAAEAGYYACIENGMSFGSLAGGAGVGTHGGSEDHLAIVCGSAGAAFEWQFVPIRPAGAAHLPAEWRFVIASSGVAADKTGSAREAYNRLSREAARLLALSNGEERTASSLAAALVSDPSAPERLRARIRTTDSGQAGTLERRLTHFLREDPRPGIARAAFDSRDGSLLGELSAASQEDAETLLQNQVPETTALVRLAREGGAFAASSFGAGFGGSVWALAEAADADRFGRTWLSHYTRQFPARTHAATFVAAPGPGLTHLS